MDKIDAKSAALVIQDMQNDLIIDGGAFADFGAPEHAKSQNVDATSRLSPSPAARRACP